MVKRSKIGKRSKKRHTKKRNKQYKKRYSKKRYNKKNNLKGGRLTPRQLELLRKVEERSSYCNRGSLPLRKKRNEQECNDRNEVCEWRNSRCMKNMMNVHSMDRFRNTEYYPPFTKVEYLVGGQVGKTTISNIPFLKENGIINDSTLILIDGEMPQRLRVINHLIKHPSPPRSPEDTPPGFGAPSPPTPPRTPPLSPEGHPPVQGEETDIWIKKRNDMEKKTRRRTGLTYSRNIYVDPQTNINIVRDVLSKEAKFESNIYLKIDDSHGRLTGTSAILNNNLHLLLTPSRGTGDEGRGVTSMTLLLMKEYLDGQGGEDLFNREGCMTLKGSFLFYSLACLWIDDVTPGKILHGKYDELKAKYNKEKELPFSVFCKMMIEDQSWLIGRPKEDANTINIMIKRMLFRILKLYKPNDKVNDTFFNVKREESERMSRVSHIKGFFGERDTKFGLTILYTNKWDENKQIHLPLDTIPRNSDGGILLSQIIKYLEPLTSLDHKLFLKHGSCRVDREYYRNVKSDQTGTVVASTEYNPDLSSETRKISTPKEEIHKRCFIEYFREPQRSDVRYYLDRFPTLIDYYVWLGSVDALDDYIDTLIQHGEGSSGLYEFISENH